ncbi:ankyrin repeat-containing protein [Dorcoceras hygrometricum]|uniref:Ankyrin repeat-containing protein n=1 Tax=Dorcoceras hygrometricum TaxID=472368 RepID=A0A2Z7A0F7_9LAMI|nr:ankyrin repeat-containing protein [Dorcoceras hygrometricum]
MGHLDLDIELERADKKSSTDSQESDDEVTTESESTSIYEDYELYLAAKNGNLNDFSSTLDRYVSPVEILSGVSPIGNNFFHIAAVHGNEGIVNYIATKDPSIVLRKNLDGDTALHLAAKAGDESMVKALVQIHHDLLGLYKSESQADIEYEADENNLLRATNEKGNTALHEASINGRYSIVQCLIKEDPDLLYYRNKQKKYALYLAAAAGFANCVSSILEYSTDEERVNEQFKEMSPIEVAIMNKRGDVLEVILDSSPRFIKLQDRRGMLPLHYAASLGYVEVTLLLLKRHASGAYIRDKIGSFPIHLAAVGGHVDVISLLLNYCHADPVELQDKWGQNILHLAAANGRLNVVTYILHNPELKKLINMSDKYGDKPLHLATKYWHLEIVSALTWDNRVNIKLRNDKGMTALDVADRNMWFNPPFRQRLTWAALKAAGAPRSHGNPKQSSKYPTEKYKDRVNTLLLVATLVATISFSAGFTLPGGYSTSDTNIGMAALLRKKAFHIFIFCDTIAVYSSIVVAVSLIWAQLGDVTLMINALTLAQPLLVIALTMISMAFTAGIFLVVRNLHWLSTVVLVIGFAFLAVLLALLVPLCVSLTSSNRILRYISYYPFFLLVLATRTKSPHKKDG